MSLTSMEDTDGVDGDDGVAVVQVGCCLLNIRNRSLFVLMVARRLGSSLVLSHAM